MSISSGLSVRRKPAPRSARCNGSSPTTNSAASGWCLSSHCVVVTTVLAMSSI